MNKSLVVTVSAAGALAMSSLVPLTQASAATPNNIIKVDRSIDKVKLGNKKRVVINKVGMPHRVSRGINGQGTAYQILHYRDGLMFTLIDGYGVSNMETSSPQQRTRDGVRVGATLKKLRKHYRVTCERVATEPRNRLCLTREVEQGVVTTTFWVNRYKEITAIGIGTPVD